jgi:hypothetical protein
MENQIDPIEEQFRKIQESKQKKNNYKKKTEFDVKNYLDIKLTGKETEKELDIRVLNSTQDPTTPFVEVYTHYLPSLKKTYICTKHTPNLPEGTNTECPFCDIREEAKRQQKALNGSDDAMWNKLKDIYKANEAVLNYVVRVIDRNDEAFGIKFWKFSQKVYEFLFTCYKANKRDEINIFDPHQGKDLIVTAKKEDDKTKVSGISARNGLTPLADSEEKIQALINDTKVWTDVYGIKTYEYLDIVINGGTPYFDKSTNKWIDKKEKDEAEKAMEEEYNEVEESEGDETAIVETPITTPTVAQTVTPTPTVTPTTEVTPMVKPVEDDLPF